MDESNHDMDNMFTQKIGTLFHPLIQNSNQSYQLLANQMGRIIDILVTAQTLEQQIPQIMQVMPK